jgi:hypothetical protein
MIRVGVKILQKGSQNRVTVIPNSLLLLLFFFFFFFFFFIYIFLFYCAFLDLGLLQCRDIFSSPKRPEML